MTKNQDETWKIFSTYSNMTGKVWLCLHGNVKGSDRGGLNRGWFLHGNVKGSDLEVVLKMWWFIYMKCEGDD